MHLVELAQRTCRLSSAIEQGLSLAHKTVEQGTGFSFHTGMEATWWNLGRCNGILMCQTCKPLRMRWFIWRVLLFRCAWRKA